MTTREVSRLFGATVLRLRCTPHQAALMVTLGLDKRLGVDPSRSMVIEPEDCDTILRTVPRRAQNCAFC